MAMFFWHFLVVLMPATRDFSLLIYISG